jgi:hypothetical protein
MSMNLCRNCNSEYAQPGTCNCFAPGGLRFVPPPAPVFVPWVRPAPVFAPWFQPTPTTGTPVVPPYGTRIHVSADGANSANVRLSNGTTVHGTYTAVTS